MENLDVWFRKEVQQWRRGASIGWTLLSLPVILIIYNVCVHFQPFHPISWLSDCFSLVLSGLYLIHCLILMVVTLGWCLLTSTSYTVVPEIVQTQLQKYTSLFSVNRLTYAGACLVFGAVSSWVCTDVIGDRYAHLTIKSDRDEYFLNEYHIFLVLYGAFTGICFLLFHYLHQNNYLQFPALQQSKFFYARSRAVYVFMQSSKIVFHQTMVYYPVFWIFGHIPKDFILSHLYLKRSSPEVNTLYGLFDLRLLWQTVLCGLFIHFILNYASMLYKIYSTEHYSFMIECAFEDQKNHCLINALTCEDNLLVKHLGYLDLAHLSQHSAERRQQVFSLSQPGGHPHNWNKLCGACLTEINNFNKILEASNWKVLTSVPVRPPCSEKSSVLNTNGAQGDIPVSTLTYRGTGNYLRSSAKDDTIQENVQKPSLTSKSSVLQYLQKKPGFSYFLMEIPDSNNRKLFSEAQIYVWAVEALSNFAAASFSEDRYGVVQRSLPDIITAIINLEENVEKHFKLSSSGMRRYHKEIGAVDIPLKYLLQTTLKASLYRVINTFGKHLLSLKLPPETAKKVKQFMEYRE